MQDDLLVVTGTLGILELTNWNNQSKKIYLNHDKKAIPVPEYFWKIVQHPKTKAAIVFITSNNPFRVVDNPPPLCASICESSNWAKGDTLKEFMRPDQGLTVCCQINVLTKAVLTSMPVLEVSGVLNF